jgi:hypothetical protein
MTTLPSTIHERIALPTSPRPAAMPAAPGGLTATDILTMLRRRMLLIFVLSFLFSAMVIGGFLLWWFKFPGYRSESLIECITNIPETEISLEQQRMREDEHERFVQTQAMMLKSPNILAETLKVSAVRETDWFKDIEASNKPGSWRKKEPLLELDKDLTASPVRGTNFLLVAIECHDPDDPAVIVNNVVARWYEEVKKRSAEEFTGDPLAGFRRDAENIEAEIKSKRDRLKALAARMPAGAREDPGNNITAQNVRQYAEQVAIRSSSNIVRFSIVQPESRLPRKTGPSSSRIRKSPSFHSTYSSCSNSGRRTSELMERVTLRLSGSITRLRRPKKGLPHYGWSGSISGKRICAKRPIPPMKTRDTPCSFRRKTWPRPRRSCRTRTDCFLSMPTSKRSSRKISNTM